jgi:isopropylmalate/homocitrate/citramalate synthase
MDKPAVFTDEEIARFRAELAGKRVPGAHAPGRWSVSPLNRRPDVRGPMPPSVRLRDATLRSVETLPGVVASTAAKEAYLRQLVGAGVREVVTAGLAGRDDKALRTEVEVIKGENADCRALLPLLRTTEDIDRAADAGYDGVQIWVQGLGEASLIYQPLVYQQAWRGEDWRTAGPARSRAEVLARAVPLIRHARDRGLHAVVPMLMVSYLTEEVLQESVAVLTEAGAAELTLFDGPGALSPEAYGHLVARTKEAAPGVEVGLHPHNTFGLAVGCAIAAVKAGADVVELSVNGYCGGPGNADLAATAMAFETLYGVDTGLETRQLTGLARAGEELTGYRVAWNHPVTGTSAFCWGGLDIITQETAVDPLLHNCVEPTLVGNTRVVPFTPDSGPYTLADKLAALGVDTTPALVDEVLRRARAAMAREGRLLTDADLAALAREAADEAGPQR